MIWNIKAVNEPEIKVIYLSMKLKTSGTFKTCLNEKMLLINVAF